MSVSEKPIPSPPLEDLPMWNAALEGRVLFPRCRSCGGYQRRLEPICPRCQHEVFDWKEVSGRATIYSYAIARQTATAGFEEEIPYVVVQVVIDEDRKCAIVTNLTGDFDLSQIDIGLPVIAEFEKRGEFMLLQFRLDDNSSLDR